MTPDDFDNLCRDLLRRLRYFDFATLASVPLEPEEGNQTPSCRFHDCAALALWIAPLRGQPP